MAAFGLFTLPVRAMPAASVQLFRLDAQRLHSLPGIEAATAVVPSRTPAESAARAVALATSAPQPAIPVTLNHGSSAIQTDAAVLPPPPLPPLPSDSAPLLAQADDSNSGNGAPVPLTSLSQTFVSPLPNDLVGTIRLVDVAEDGTLGAVLEEIPFDSSQITISSDRLVLTVVPSRPIPPGQSVMLQLPSRSPTGVAYVYPEHLASTPCLFKVPATTAAAAAPLPAAAVAPAAAAAAIPTWAIVVGAVVVGVGVAAAAGAFSSTGGTSQSSQ